MSRDSGAYVPNSAHAPNFGSRFRNRSETKIPPYPSDFVGIYASVLFLHLEQKKFKQIYEKYQNKKFRSNIGISAVSSDIDIGVGLLPHTYTHTIKYAKNGRFT